jgi:hypothetical protein
METAMTSSMDTSAAVYLGGLVPTAKLTSTSVSQIRVNMATAKTDRTVTNASAIPDGRVPTVRRT